MLAIAVLRSRVAPVLDWCSRFLIYPQTDAEEAAGLEVVVDKSGGYEVVKSLREQGVTSVICGALTAELLHHAEHLGMHVIHGVAGAIPEIYRAYQVDELDRPEFRLPGCRGPRCYRKRMLQADTSAGKQWKEESMQGRGQGQGQGQGRGQGQGQGRGQGQGQGRGGCRGTGNGSVGQGVCYCPKCGKEAAHQRGIPCTEVRCPQCDQPMLRRS